MSERGSVHTYHAGVTEADPENPGQRRRRVSKLWYWRFYHRGRPYCGGPGQTSRTAARELGEARRRELQAGIEGDPRKTTLAALERIMGIEYQLRSASTRANWTTITKRWHTFFSPKDLVAGITRTRLIEYVAHRQRAGNQPTTINLDLSVLHHAMALGHEQGIVLAVPRFPRLPQYRRQQEVRPEELRRILAAMTPHWRRFFLAAAEIGWRSRSELLTRQWPHVDFEGGWVNLEPTANKTRRARVFPMTEYLRVLLLDQRAWVEELQRHLGQIIPWVFPRQDGTAPPDYRRAWSSACKRAGFGKLEGRTGPWSGAKVPHDLRRSALRRWELLGIPRNASMGAAGHGEERTFSGYTQATPEALKDMARRLDEARKKDG